MSTGKYGPEKTRYLATFHAVLVILNNHSKQPESIEFVVFCSECSGTTDRRVQ